MINEDDARLICSGYWEGDPEHPKEDWMQEVAAGETLSGYWQWVEARREMQ